MFGFEGDDLFGFELAHSWIIKNDPASYSFSELLFFVCPDSRVHTPGGDPSLHLFFLGFVRFGW